MNQMALPRAVGGATTPRGIFNSTSDTYLDRPCDGCISAFTRTVFDRSVYRFARVETVSTLRASGGATVITNYCGTGTGLKVIPTDPAWSDGSAIGEKATSCQFGMCNPELNIRLGMTSGAQRNEIGEHVSRSIVLEEVEWANVMHRQVRSGYAAMLACVPVPLSRRRPLSVPIRPAVIDMAAEPRRIVLSRHSGRAPYAKTSTTAKVVWLDHAWCAFNGFGASIACDRNALLPNTNAVRALPFSVARLVAKMVFLAGKIRLCFVELAAMRARGSNHAHINSDVWRIVNDNHFARI